MSEANYTAHANAKANILTLAANITIQRDANGRYAHDAATRFKNLFILQLGACYNDTQPGEGMRKLADDGDNSLTVIKSTDRVTAESVLLEAKKAAATLKRQTNVDEKPRFETRAEAKVEADDRNYAIQATIGTKEGAAEAITTIVGSDITDNVLRHTDGSPKGVDEYRLAALFHAVAIAAKRPTEKEMVALKVGTLQFQFDWRKSFQINMEQLRATVNKITSYRLSFDNNDTALVVLSNIHEATQHHYGRDFRETLRSLRQTYRYDFQHNNTSIADIMAQLTAADSLRDPADAPAPESARAVTDSMALLSEFVHDMNLPTNFDEQALGVNGSDSDSSHDTKRSPRTSRRGEQRNNSRDSRRRARHHSQSRDRKPPTRWQDNPCKHCQKFKRRTPHPNTPSKDCFWNPKLKVFRPRAVCDEMELPYVPRYKFDSDSEDE